MTRRSPDPPIRTAAAGPVLPLRPARLTPLPLTAVRLHPQSFLGAWQERNAAATIQHCLDNVERTGRRGR